mmetsp:Transcript_7411/g.26482  ORF Transcript_7411/g.26482 Transcript_7411/m.26482 type:complete len:325 (-) Transcript_7411:802-1776(-)
MVRVVVADSRQVCGGVDAPGPASPRVIDGRAALDCEAAEGRWPGRRRAERWELATRTPRIVVGVDEPGEVGASHKPAPDALRVVFQQPGKGVHLGKGSLGVDHDTEREIVEVGVGVADDAAARGMAADAASIATLRQLLMHDVDLHRRKVKMPPTCCSGCSRSSRHHSRLRGRKCAMHEVQWSGASTLSACTGRIGAVVTAAHDGEGVVVDGAVVAHDRDAQRRAGLPPGEHAPAVDDEPRQLDERRGRVDVVRLVSAEHAPPHAACVDARRPVAMPQQQRGEVAHTTVAADPHDALVVQHPHVAAAGAVACVQAEGRRRRRVA